MQANVLVRPGRLELREVERSTPGPGEVVVRVRAAPTCATDLKAYLEGQPKMPVPTLFGREFSGETADVGDGVRKFKAGDAVAKAAMLEPLACGVHSLDALNKGQNSEGQFVPRAGADDIVLIMGAGAIGLIHLMLLRAAGIERIIVCGKGNLRLRLARELGAAIVVGGEHEEIREILFEATHGRGVDVVIKCTGKPEVWQQALSLVRRGGTVVVFGGCSSGSVVELDTSRTHYDQITLLSPFHYTWRAVRKAYDLLSEERIAVGRWITGEFPPRRLVEVFEILQHGEGVRYAVIP